MIKVQVNDYIIRSRREAEDVLNKLVDHAAKYGAVSIGDYYDLIGVTASIRDYVFGWTFDVISKATVHDCREYNRYGSYIKLPNAEVINVGMKDELIAIFKEEKKGKRIQPEKHDIIESAEHGYCIVLHIVTHSESNQNMVVYHTFESKETLVTPLEMFTSDKFKVAFNVKSLNGLIG